MRLSAALAALLATVLQAAAANLPIDGAYGNPAGCKAAATDDLSDDSLLLLTPQRVSTYATSCAFTGVTPQADGAFAVAVLCDHEGEEEKTTGAMRIRKDGVDAYVIFDEDGSSWGKVGRC